MLRGLLVELSSQKRTTLLHIANGDDRSDTHDQAHVTRLQLLALIEDKGPFIDLSAQARKGFTGWGVGNALAQAGEWVTR
jgi:hypothetical protein